MHSRIGDKRAPSLAPVMAIVIAGVVLAAGFAAPSVAGPDKASRALEKNDRNDDGKVSRKEWRKSGDVFDAIDTDGDGFLTIGEFRARFGEKANKAEKAGATPQPAAEPKPAAATPLVAAHENLYFIDAHSQWDHRVDAERVLSLMDRGGVYRTILSVHLKRPWQDLAAFADEAPGRIVPAVQIKGRGYHKGPPDKYFDRLRGQTSDGAFAAMAEVHVWHDSDGGKYQEIRIDFDDPLFRAAFDAAKGKGWPLIVHMEFNALSHDAKRDYMAKLENFVAANRDHPFVMIHMAQLEEPDVRRLVASHSNLHFLTSHASPFYQFGGKPFINMIDGDKLKPEWRQLFIEYPDRFVFALDNVFSKFWMPDGYLGKMRMWWRVAADLPAGVAHAFAHGNAERLWKLPPKAGGGMMPPDQALKALGPVTGRSANAAHR